MHLTIPPRELLRRFLRTALGMVIFAFGNYLTVQANIGQAPWNVLCQGISLHLPLSYGVSTMLVSVMIVVTDVLLGEPIGLATLMDAAMVGPLLDLFLYLDLVPVMENVWVGFVLMTVGMAFLALGQLVYMPAQFSCGPRAALTVGVGKRLRRLPIGAVEILIQTAACAVGWLIGGSVGLGTLWFALGNGFVMQAVFQLARFEPRNLTHIGLHQMVARTEREGAEQPKE